MKILYLIALVSISSCTFNRHDCIYYSGELLRNYLERIKIRRIDSATGAIIEIVDKVDGKSYFGQYTFYNDGMLQAYKFFGNALAYSYNEEYDKHGNIIYIEGSPLVLRNIKDINRDSLFIQFYFSSINRKYDSLKIRVNTVLYTGLKIETDSTYSNMMKASYYFNVKDMDTIRIYLTADVQNNCKKDIDKLKDTLFLITNNNTHEVIKNRDRRLLE